ncbi:MAG: ComF family protein [Hyphomicrobiaceae bacterium]
MDLMMPPLCLACRVPLATHATICPACWSKIDFIRPPLCDRLGLPLPYDAGAGAVSAAAAAHPPVYGRARAVARYDGVMRQMIHDLKFHDRHDAVELLARWMQEAGGELLETADVLVPVPLHRLKLLQRRFNQAAVLTVELSRSAGRPAAPLALVRARATQRQLGLTRDQRQSNVAGAFEVPRRRQPEIAGRRVLLVDDVITTGATVSAAARKLLDAGAVSVDVLALALVADTSGTLIA